MPEVQWIADGVGGPYDWTLARALEEQHMAEDEIVEDENSEDAVQLEDEGEAGALYPCLISLAVAALGLVFIT